MTLRHFCLLTCTFLCAFSQDGLGQSAMVPWVTRSADNSRSGWNSQETQLTQASVTSKGIVRATIIPVTGDARGMEAQPLILPKVKLADGTTHDVMVLMKDYKATADEMVAVLLRGNDLLDSPG